MIYLKSYLLWYSIVHPDIPGMVRVIATLQTDLSTLTHQISAVRKEVITIRRIVSSMEPATKQQSLKLNTALPVTNKEGLADLEKELKEEGKKATLVG